MGAKKKGHNAARKSLANNSTTSLDKTLSHDKEPAEENSEAFDFTQVSHINTMGFDDSRYNDQQQEEYGVLASIYCGPADAFERIEGKRDPWKQFDNLAYAFNISSFHNKDFNARLEIEYPVEYPKVPFKARLLELQPRQERNLEDAINKDIAEVPKQQSDLLGKGTNQGVQALIDAINDHLDSAAQAFANAHEGRSLLEVRAEEEALLRDHMQAEQARTIAHKQQEDLKHNERLRQALRLEKLRRHDPNAPELHQEQDPNSEEIAVHIPFRFNETIVIRSEGSEHVLKFRAVSGTHKMLERSDKKVGIVHPVIAGKVCEQQFLLKQIFIPDTVAPKTVLESAMDDIRKTLEDCKNNDHPNVVKVYAYQIDHDVEDASMTEWKISILSEYSTAGSVIQSLEITDSYSAGKVRLYGTQVLQALDFIEKLGYVYPAVHLRNMLLFRDPHGGMRIKLSDGYGTTLRDLVRKSRDPKDPAPARDVGWTPPELVHGRPIRTHKTSIWDFGLVLIQMAFLQGYEVEQRFTSPEKILWRDDLDIAYLEVLRNAFQTVPRKRPTAFDLMSFSFFKGGSKAINIPTAENPGREPHLLRSGIAGTMKSMWEMKWQKAGKLGQGGFGQVVKAQNVDDGQYYAVKRLLCATPKDLNDIWAEVRLLAQLNHPGVVRYYNAWSEEERDDDDDDYFQAAAAPQNQPVQSIRGSTRDQPDPFSTGHDFMDPSIHRPIGPEYDSSEDDDNLFGYQSPPSDSGDDYDDVDETGPEAESLDELFQRPGMPQFSDEGGIQFGDDDDDTGDNNSSSNKNQPPSRDTDVEPRSPFHNRRRSSAPRKSTLYIQMELCETDTLANLIKRGLPYKKSKVWELLEQILRALDHIHSYGIVHRDLKPANIFISSSDNIKIGDFGLAVTGQANRAVHSTNVTTPTLTAGPSSRGVGTLYYTAPELERGGSGQYSTKADMFSLGVILFQMCFPITTETEKMTFLRRISEEEHFEMPEYFEQEGLKSQAEIISKLISHNQDDRPSARELLEGGYLPETVDTGTVQRYINKLAEEEPEEFQRLMDRVVLRSKKFSRAQELAYFVKSRRGASSGLEKYIVDMVNCKFRQIFQRHGAVDSERIDAMPARDFYNNAAEFLDDTGKRLQLPFDLTLPFAAILADERPDFSKHYCFGTVYRRAIRGTQPTRVAEINYDHVSSSARGLSLKDAQVIKVLDELITELPLLASRALIIYVNHGDLLDLILEYCKVPAGSRDFVVEQLSYLHVRDAGWKDVRARLLNPKEGVTERMVSALAAFNLQADFNKARNTINALFDDEFASRAVRPLTRLEEIFDFTKALRVETDIKLSPLSNQSEPLYQGSIMFQCVDIKSAKIFAVGGRYDKLIEYYQQPEVPKGITRAVGFRINTIALNAWSVAYYKKTLTSAASKSRSKNPRDTTAQLHARLDVVVTSFDESTLQGHCLEILSSLLANGIKAEVSEHFRSMEQLDAAYGEPLNYWLVIVRPGGTSNKRQIKVRSPDREEQEVRQSELVGLLKAEIGERATGSHYLLSMSGPSSEPRLRRTSSHGEHASATPIVLARGHKDKKTNRMNIADAVSSAAKQLGHEISTTAPIVAFAPDSDATLQGLRGTRLSDGESWRTFRQAVPLEDRAYLQKVQEQLEELAQSGKEGAFVVNYLTNTCIYYDLGASSSRRG